MKLVAAVIASLVSLTTLARADEYRGPPGNYGQPVEAPPVEAPVDRTAPPFGGAAGRAQVPAVEPPRFAPPPRGPRGQLRQMILQRFDRNHDGRLEPNERRQAARALRRIARQLARGGGQPGRQMRQQVIDRYDLNGDGNVGPGEMPPAMAKRLRRLDRNGDGWVDDRDFAP